MIAAAPVTAELGLGGPVPLALLPALAVSRELGAYFGGTEP